ncbi:MAG TPA: 2-oxo-4-hydroxy-4-carboxy-5-ureidoimidazoline decarboxylase [Noviherbaspirillum sp.]|nr:2-oxo-4-hydroxy-4-carboxy-5-ureidoimidazoline decarboxylase [Noviherbaspirillum sp.]
MPTTSSYDLATINAMDRTTFTDAFGDVFEHSAYVASAAWDNRPFASASALHASMMNVIRGLSIEEQKAFLRGHPELSPTAIRSGVLTESSSAEQSSAGLDALTHDESARLREMNRAYQERHDFPFIICVRHYTRKGVFAELERRLGRNTEQEFDEAMQQIAFITRGRLELRLRAEHGECVA